MAVDIKDFSKGVLKHFQGIDAKREQILKEIAVISSKKDVYNPSYISNFTQEKRQELIADRQDRAAKAKEEIAALKQAMTAKKFKDPYQSIYDDPDIKVIHPEHKLLAEMQHNKKMTLLQAEIAAADSPEEFKLLLEEYGEYEDFHKLLNLEIKKRAKDITTGSKFKALQLELEKEPTEFQELKKLEATINFIGNSDMHPSGLDTGDLRMISYEPLIPNR